MMIIIIIILIIIMIIIIIIMIIYLTTQGLLQVPITQPGLCEELIRLCLLIFDFNIQYYFISLLIIADSASLVII